MKRDIGKPILSRHTSPMVSRKKGKKLLNGGSQTKFDEFVKMDMEKIAFSAEYDLNMEAQLAKKLKVKGGKLRGMCDGLNSLFCDIRDKFDEDGDVNESISKKHIDNSSNKGFNKITRQCSYSDNEFDNEISENEVEEPLKSSKKRKLGAKSGSKEVEMAEVLTCHSHEHYSENVVSLEENEKYIAPHLRSHPEDNSVHTQTRRRVRGLLNNLSKSNVQLFTTEMAYIVKSIGCSVGTKIIMNEILTAYSRGVQCHEQFAALTAGMTCSVGIDFGVNLLADCATHFEEMYAKDDFLALRNLALFFAHLFIYKVFDSDLLYDFLDMMTRKLADIDVSLILTILLCCGMKLRSDNPSSMKDYITNVQSRVNELKSFGEGGENVITKKMEFMLKIIFDIKNNTKNGKNELVQDQEIKKWLEKLNIEEVKICGMTWTKLVDPNKTGKWWCLEDELLPTNNSEDITKVMDTEITELEKMKKLATEQRMNTGARQAIFCVIMSGEDYADTVKNLLKLNFSGKQDREIMRVLVECCLQEKVFNKYYTILAKKLCQLNKNHKFSLQYCIWDHYKELESMELGRSMCLAKFVSEILASFTLSASLIKAAGLDDASRMTPRRVMHFRMLFDALFQLPVKTLWNIFTRLAATPALHDLCNAVNLFVTKSVVPTCVENDSQIKCRAVKKALVNSDGILM